MKKIMIFLLVICICGLTACRKAAENEIKIDYGNSELYSKEDMDEAITMIKELFSTWEGCELHSISYVSDDECNPENIAWLNELRDGVDKEFEQCIVFKSDFHSPKESEGAWNADEEYTDWQWWLARSNGGTWKLITFGY